MGSGSVSTVNSGFPSPEEFEEFLRRMNQNGGGPSTWANLPESLGPIKAIFESLQGAVSNSHVSTELPIDWSQTEKTSAQILATMAKHLPIGSEFGDADRIARSWAKEASAFAVKSEMTEIVTRAAWLGLSLPSLKVVAGPIAQRSSADALQNFQQLMPGQPEEFYQVISAKLSGVAAHLHGVQLGQLHALLAEGVLIGSEFSFSSQQQPMIIVENAREFAESTSGPAIDALIYLATRELLSVALFDANPWIKESLQTQVIRYATHLTFSSSGMQDIQEAIQNSDFDSLSELVGTMVNVEPSPEQSESRVAIQHLVSLITGWVDQKVLQACRHLDNLAAIDEAYRRRRATNSPNSRAFRLLLNIDFEAGQIRSAAAFWSAISGSMSGQQADDIWRHPDLMPIANEVVNPELFLARLSDPSEDAIDSALRKLLGDPES